MIRSLGAGCGQLFLARRKAYFDSEGHKAIQGSRHDGLKLPRSFRASGFSSDLVDASQLAEVRMYEGWSQVRNGLLKNATEGFANWRLIPIFTLLLIGGSVLPLMGLGHAIFWKWTDQGTLETAAAIVLATATAINWVGAFCIQGRMNHPLVSAVLHPVAVAVFMLLQWTALNTRTTWEAARGLEGPELVERIVGLVSNEAAHCRRSLRDRSAGWLTPGARVSFLAHASGCDSSSLTLRVVILPRSRFGL